MPQKESVGSELLTPSFSALHMPKELALAANSLQRLASEGMSQQWLDCSDPAQVKQQQDAIDACRSALSCIESTMQENAQHRLDKARARVAALESIMEGFKLKTLLD